MIRTLLATALLTLMMPTMGSADDADAEKQVGMISKQYREAVVKGDWQTVTAMQSDDWVGIHPQGEVADKAKATKDMKDRTIVFESIEPSEVKVRVYGDAAVVSGRYHVKLKDKGRQFDDDVRTTEVFVKRAGKWQCVSTQVTRILGESDEKR